MKLRSGISKEFKTHFILDEDALIRLHGVLEKAAKSLQADVQVVFRVEREDDRFYETTNISDVVSDPNIYGKKVTLVSIEIRDNRELIGTQREWIALIIFLGERKWAVRYKDTDEIHINISTEDRNWALLLADELEPQVMRTINKSEIPKWPLLGIGVFLVYVFLKLYYFTEVRYTFNKSLINFFFPAMIILLLVYLIVSRLTDESLSIDQWLSPETVFLWGEELKKFPEREQTRKNIFWGGLIAFIVSLLASVIVTLM